MRKHFCVIAFIFLTGDLWKNRGALFNEAEHQFRIGSNPAISPTLISFNTDTIAWTVPTETLMLREGEGTISLVCTASDDLLWDELRKVLSSSGLEIRATARMDDGTKVDRLVRNWYYTTDQPFSERRNLPPVEQLAESNKAFAHLRW